MKSLFSKKMIILVLVLQFIPIVLFPASSFAPNSQEWWLPVLLAAMAIVAMVQILRKSVAPWPWYLLGFAQGFNIISRLMMILPHATIIEEGQQYFNTPYVVMSVLAMAMSWFVLWYVEQPEVRMNIMRD